MSTSGIDVSLSILPALKIELEQSLVAAGIQANKLKLTHSESLYDTRVQRMVNPEGAVIQQLQAKVRYTCPHCQHTWTSGLGQFTAIIEQKRVKRGCYAINFRVLSYTHECKKCQVRGEVKPYEDEMERISTNVARESL